MIVSRYAERLGNLTAIIKAAVSHTLNIPNFQVLLFAFSPLFLFAQIGGLNTFEFLNLPQSARTNALGGYTIAIVDDDINLAYGNPALLNSQMNRKLAVNHNFHLADISHGFAAYGFTLPNKNLHAFIGANYISYGDFVRSNETGIPSGQFSGREVALTLGMATIVQEKLRLGGNLKIVRSRFDNFESWGIGVDLAATYEKSETQSVFSLVLNNMGYQLSTFSQSTEKFPFNLQLGFSKRLEHLPFRFMITAHHLNRWDLRNDFDQGQDPIFLGEEPSEKGSFSKGVENFFRHISFGGEFLIGKNEIMRLRLGYNHQRKKELAVNGFRSFSGFSYGFGIKVKKITFDYSVSKYHFVGGVNHLSLIINLERLMDNI